MKNIKYFIFILSFFFFRNTIVYAQPQPCGNPAVMTSYCSEACIICDIDGFTGVNSYTQKGEAPPGFCTSFVHNIKWIAFQAGSVDLQLEVSVFKCQKGSGLEIGIYKSLDCKNFELVSNCETDIPTNTKAIFTNTKPLTIGQYYYFVMDGGNGDVCSYTVKVLKGTTAVSPLDDSGSIIGEPLVCPNVLETYKKTEVKGATLFNWTLDNISISKSDSVNIKWTTIGLHELCVTASNACDKATPSCMTIEVRGIDTTFIDKTLCDGDCLKVANTQLCKTGKYVFDLITEKGCDSTIVVNLKVNPVYSNDISVTICDGDTIQILGQALFKDGIYSKTGQTWKGCDSTITVDLKVIECNIKGIISASDIKCYGESSGSLMFAITNGTPPFKYNCKLVGSTNILSTGTVLSLNSNEIIKNLVAGNYIISIEDNFGNSRILLASIKEPTQIQANSILSNYHGTNISCFGGNDGTILVNGLGGTPPYSFYWNNQVASNDLSGLIMGEYILTITDAAGCNLVNVYNLNEPIALKINQADFVNPTCEGLKTGEVTITSISGGVAPYTFDLNGKGFSDQKKYTGLAEGNYTWSVQDANGCLTDISGKLTAPEIPIIGLPDDFTIELGDVEQIQTFLNIVADSILWQNNAGLSCYNCLEPLANPTNSTNYTLTVGSKDHCYTSESINITVLPNYNLFIPNVFSPNGDGFNDRFSIFSGKGVKTIRNLFVYSRWGALLYAESDVDPYSVTRGWDGTVNSKQMDSGVYVWYAEIEFLDGHTQSYKGDVNLLR